jgi:hypothetical protein
LLQEADVLRSTVSSEGSSQPIASGSHGIKSKRVMVGYCEKRYGGEWSLDVWSCDGNLQRRRKKKTGP